MERTGSSVYQASETIFHDLLSQQPKRQAKNGVDRFCAWTDRQVPGQRGGPARAPGMDRRRSHPAGEDLTARQVIERLLSYRDDVELLRCYLFDFGLLERIASGSS